MLPIFRITAWGLATAIFASAATGQSALYEIEGKPYDFFGTHLIDIGDASGDGVDDFAAFQFPGTTVFSGADGTPLFRIPFYGSRPAGDVDGDGRADLLTIDLLEATVHIHSGRDGHPIRAMLVPPEGPLGRLNVIGGRDVDGDGVPDLLSSPTPARVDVISGATGDKIIPIPGGVVRFDGPLAFVGDIDGDGADDFAAGEWSLAPGGAVHFFSSATGALLNSVPGAPGEALGNYLKQVGDLDGDGCADVAAFGRLHVMRVLSSATGATLFSLSPLPAHLTSPRFLYPNTVAGVGDLDGDGVPDLAVSGFEIGDPFNPSPGPPSKPGFIEIRSGATSTLIRRIFAPSVVWFGVSCAEAGDLDGDGFIDILAGALPYIWNSADVGRAFALTRGRRPGSFEDLTLFTGFRGAPGLGPDHLVVHVPDVVSLQLITFGTFDYEPFVIGADPFPTGLPPMGPAVPAFPAIHLRPSRSVVLVDGVSGGPGSPVLDPTGVAASFPIPPIARGYSMVVQGLAFSTASRNGFFAATDGHELELR